MKLQLRKAFEAEMTAATRLHQYGDMDDAFRHLEAAHVLGQRHLVPHVATHCQMLVIGWKRGSPREVLGQALRIVLGALGSALGIVPTGNTGGANIGMFKRLPIEPRLRHLVE